MNVVLDTNIAVSASISELGPSALIIKAWRRGGFIWLTSDALLAELNRAIRYPRVTRRSAWTEDLRVEYVETIRRGALFVSPTRTIDILRRDPDDNRLLEAAAAGEADYVVSGDAQLLGLGTFEGTVIVSPARFLKILATQT